MTVYIVIPPEHLRTQSPLIRVWVNGLLRAVIQGGLTHKKVHFLLDEAGPAIGNMPAVGDALVIGRSYGVRLTLIYQSMGQLKACWPEDGGQTLLSNTTQVLYAVNDLETAKYTSERLDQQTIYVDSGSTGTSSTIQQSQSGIRVPASPGAGNGAGV